MAGEKKNGPRCRAAPEVGDAAAVDVLEDETQGARRSATRSMQPPSAGVTEFGDKGGRQGQGGIASRGLFFRIVQAEREFLEEVPPVGGIEATSWRFSSLGPGPPFRSC